MKLRKLSTLFAKFALMAVAALPLGDKSKAQPMDAPYAAQPPYAPGAFMPMNTADEQAALEGISRFHRMAKELRRAYPVEEAFLSQAPHPSRQDYMRIVYKDAYDKAVASAREYRRQNPGMDFVTSMSQESLTGVPRRRNFLGSGPSRALPGVVELNPHWLFLGNFTFMTLMDMHESEHAMGQNAGDSLGKINMEEYILSPHELAVRMALVKRLYYTETGRVVDSPQEAVRAYRAMGIDLDPEVVSGLFAEKRLPAPIAQLQQPTLPPAVLHDISMAGLDFDQFRTVMNGCKKYRYPALVPWFNRISQSLPAGPDGAPQVAVPDEVNLPPLRENRGLYREVLKKLIFGTPGMAMNSQGPSDVSGIA